MLKHLNSVIKECVTGQELGGGIAITDGMVVEVSIDTSLSEASKSTTLGARRVRKAKSRTKIKTKATTRPKHKKVKSKTKSRAKPEKTKTKPRPKKTKAKPKKTKSKACPIKNKKTPGKKSSKNGLRSLIQTLLPRAGSQQSSSDECGPFDEDMHIPAGWGETYFGFTEEIYSTMTKKKLLNLAKIAWDQAHKKKPTRLLLVAALYVPNHGVYFGTIPHKGGEDRFKRDCASFTALWDIGLRERGLERSSASQQLYHAEDAAMLYAFKKGAFGDGPQFPPGSMLVTFGEEKARGTPPKHVAACHQGNSNILPTCSQVLGWMGINK
ncbi:hypothetical protein SLS60_008524 [Paraconiothyrium brasiliense]|uniref:Uncharacterized protein n=1 Tax=Paraconiothyrium brasiliense TaxID=300254 RepID=A0ABR3R0V0_9PLEO